MLKFFMMLISLIKLETHGVAHTGLVQRVVGYLAFGQTFYRSPESEHGSSSTKRCQYPLYRPPKNTCSLLVCSDFI